MSSKPSIAVSISDEVRVRDQLRRLYGWTSDVDLQPRLDLRRSRTLWTARIGDKPFAMIKLLPPRRAQITDVERDAAYQDFCAKNGFPAPAVIKTQTNNLVGEVTTNNNDTFKAIASRHIEGLPLDGLKLSATRAANVISQVAQWPAEFSKIWKLVDGPIQTFPHHTESDATWQHLATQMTASNSERTRLNGPRLAANARDLHTVQQRVAASQQPMMPAELLPKDCVLTNGDIVVPVDWEDCSTEQWRYIHERVGSEMVLRDNWTRWAERATNYEISRDTAAFLFIESMTESLHGIGATFPSEFEGDALIGMQLRQLREAIQFVLSPTSSPSQKNKALDIIEQRLAAPEIGQGLEF